MTARLKNLKSGSWISHITDWWELMWWFNCSIGSNSVTPEESAKIRKSYEDAVKQWRKRKRLVCAVQLLSV